MVPKIRPEQDIQVSWGERLLPFLFIGLETCCIDAIFIGFAEIRALGTGNLLLPLWMPFVLIASFYTLSSSLFRQKTSSRWLRFPLSILAALFGVWGSVYATRISLLDPVWLLNLPHVLAQFDTTTFQVVGVFALSFLLCRHGSLLADQSIQPRYVLNVLYFGLCSLLLLMLIRAMVTIIRGSLDDEKMVILLIALFLCLALTTHALARIVSVRRRYNKLRVKRAATQDRMTLQLVIGLSLAFLLLALLSGFLLRATTSGRLSARTMQPASSVCSSRCTVHPSLPKVTSLTPSTPAPVHIPVLPFNLSLTLLALLVVFAFLVVILGATFFIWLLLRRQRQKRLDQQREEVRESLWSWSLFLAQLRNVFAALFTHFVSHWRSITLKGKQHVLGETSEALRVHTVREIYRQLLTSAARHGYPREHYETPYEFLLRLMQHQPQLRLITETYTSTRYGTIFPNEYEIVQIRSYWKELEKLWRDE